MNEDKVNQNTGGKPKAGHQQSVALNKLFYEGYMISRAIYAAAALGIADVLNEGPKDSNDIAAPVGANPDALYRLLRALASVGVFGEIEASRFAMTPLVACLRTDIPNSLRAYITLHAVRTYSLARPTSYSIV